MIGTLQNVGSCEVKQTGWSTAMSELNNQVDSLTQRLDVLYHRIEPFMRMEQTAKNPNKQPTQPKPTAIAEIDSVSERLQNVRLAVDECISRLEL
jgi:hypothetical protein